MPQPALDRPQLDAPRARAYHPGVSDPFPRSTGRLLEQTTVPVEPPAPGARTEREVAAPRSTRGRGGVGRVTILAASDILALLAAGAIAYLLWARPVHGQPVSLYLPAAPIALLVVLAYAQARLYPGFGLGPVETMRRYWLVTATAFLAMAALVFVLKLDNIYSRVTLTLALVLSLALVPLMRALTVRLASGRPWWPEPVTLVVDDGRTGPAQRMLAEQPTREFRAVGTVAVPASGERDDERVAAALDDAERFALAGVRLAFADLSGPGAEPVLDRLRMVFPRVIILREFQELPVEGVQVRNLGGVLGLEYGNNLLRRQSRWVKRALDLALGTVTFILTLPLTLATMAAVKVLSPGPALFWQDREGRKGRTIRVPKIRTMVPDAERRMEELLRSDPGLRAEWESAFKLRDDPRVIRGVGRLFRRYSIDELPQLWSVVRGDMSLVGPRPFPDYHLDALSPHARRLRDEVRPGITGLWQVSARGEAGVEAQQAYDMYYIRNWSVWLDLHILARTLAVVVSGKGAY
jgi:Undecaprenyl-phosphate galactose phosphotransferase WbaP